jgi:hypothetical protein
VSVLLVGIIGGVLWASFALAQQGELSANDAAKELANPAGSLANLANNFTYRQFKGELPGAGSQTSLSYTFQPVLPFPVGDQGRNIIVRPAFSVTFDQPVFDSTEGTFQSLSTNLNDITFDLVYAGTNMVGDQKGYLWGAGLAGTLPVATDSALGGEQWRFGPEIFGGVIRKWGVFGALVNNQWNLGGGDGGPDSNDQPYSTTMAQYFYGITLGDGWQILSAPVITYDWKADSGEALSLPIGTGIAKTLKISGTTWRFQAEVWYYVEQPDSFGNDWMVSFDVRPVIKNPLVR